MRAVVIPNKILPRDRFPFPLKENTYRYSNNSLALEIPFAVEITPEYFEEIQLKREILVQEKQQAYQSLPYTLGAQWEILSLLIDGLTVQYPEYFAVEKRGDEWKFNNFLLNEEEVFIFGQEETISFEPLDFIGRHVQEDLMFLGQRDGDLYLDAGQVCFPGNWSLPFNLGRTFVEIHEPVPFLYESGLAMKIRDFLMRIEMGSPWKRFNWTITAGNILPTLPCLFNEWGKKRYIVDHENVGTLIHLRVEEQRFFRLPHSNGLLFTIHTYMLPLNEFVQNKEWAENFYFTVLDLPEQMAIYKGFQHNKEFITTFIKKHLEKEHVNK